MSTRTETLRPRRRLALGALGIFLLGFGCSSSSPGVAGASCPAGSGGSSGFQAPSLMTTGGGSKPFVDRESVLEENGSATSALGGSDPCAPKHDAGADGEAEASF